MTIKVLKCDLAEILPLRNLFLQESNFQIRYNACHERGWTDSYILTCNDDKIGYGSVKGNENIKDRDTMFEFYVIPSFRNIAEVAFSQLVQVSGVTFIECQTNDLLLTSLLYEYGQDINANVVLFEDHVKTSLRINNVTFRKRTETDVVFDHTTEPMGDYVLALDEEIVATGGFLLHYNPPFADLFMEVTKDHRLKGFGSFLIQELKTQCYLAGRVPAARCDIDNEASRATLLKGGFKIAGFMMQANITRGG